MDMDTKEGERTQRLREEIGELFSTVQKMRADLQHKNDLTNKFI